MYRARTLTAGLLLACIASFAVPLARADEPPATAPPAAEPPSAQSFYSAAVSAMKQLPEPAYVSYRIEGQGNGLQVIPFSIRGQVWLAIGSGSIPSNWTLRHRTDDFKTEVIDVYGDRRYVTQRSFFDPTWYGSYRALRDGMLGYQDVEAPISSYATPGPDRPTTLKTIAVETVIGPSIYSVEDRGASPCENGNPGHALHLTPRTSDPRRQLTDVVVDTSSMRFCMIRYSWNNGGFNGVVEQHYADTGGYWMQTDGTLSGKFKVGPFSTHSGVWNYRLSNMQFPKNVPASAFAPNPYE
jgi:hypothetical protein